MREEENLEFEAFWDDSALELSEEEVDKLEVSEEEDQEDQEEQEQEEEESSEEESEESEESEEDEIEEDEVIQKGYEVFKDSVFKYLPEDYEFKATEEGFQEALDAVQVSLFDNVHNQYLAQLETNEKAKSYLDFLVATEGQGDFEKWIKINSSDLSSYTEEDIADTDVAKVIYS